MQLKCLSAHFYLHQTLRFLLLLPLTLVQVLSVVFLLLVPLLIRLLGYMYTVIYVRTATNKTNHIHIQY